MPEPLQSFLDLPWADWTEELCALIRKHDELMAGDVLKALNTRLVDLQPQVIISMILRVNTPDHMVGVKELIREFKLLGVDHIDRQLVGKVPALFLGWIGFLTESAVSKAFKEHQLSKKQTRALAQLLIEARSRERKAAEQLVA